MIYTIQSDNSIFVANNTINPESKKKQIVATAKEMESIKIFFNNSFASLNNAFGDC